MNTWPDRAQPMIELASNFPCAQIKRDGRDWPILLQKSMKWKQGSGLGMTGRIAVLAITTKLIMAGNWSSSRTCVFPNTTKN